MVVATALLAVMGVEPADAAPPPKVMVVGLEADAASTLLGIDNPRPRLSWRSESTGRGIVQTAAEVLVASSPELLTPQKADVWQSGRLAGARPFVDYAGPELESRTRYFWTVRVWDQDGRRTAWAPAAWFETAFVDPDEWTAEWIGAAEGWQAPLLCAATPTVRTCRRPAPVLRTEFALAKPVQRARLYAAGVGAGYYHLNGTPVADDELLNPTRSNFDKRVRYVTHDVTALMREGANALAAELGHGFDEEHDPVLRLELHIDHTDGTATVVRSGPEWRTTEGPTVFESAAHGENFDGARARALAGWTRPGYDDNAWAKAPVVAGRSGVMSAQAIEPIRVTERRRFVKITQPALGIWVLHGDQNVAGRVNVTVHNAPKGADIALGYGEKLMPDGTVEVSPEELQPTQVARSAQWDHFLPAGGGTETWAARFSYKGFQYVQVQGWPDPEGPKLEDFAVEVMHTDFAAASTWESSHDLLNQLWRNARWSVRQNWFSVPTDTPVNEKAGWTGDAQLMSAVTSYLFDPHRAYRKYYEDMADSQAESGVIADTSPGGTAGEASTPATAWHHALFELPRALELRFDDERLLRDWDAMKKYYDYFKAGYVGDDHIATAGDYGDWADPTYVDCELPSCNGLLLLTDDLPERFAEVPKRLHSTAFWYHWNLIMADAARERGKVWEAQASDVEAKAIHKAFNDAFWDQSKGAYVDPDPVQQADDAMYFQIIALAHDLVPESRAQRVADTLAADIRSRDTHLDVGIIGAKFALPVLSKYGHHQLAFDVATQTTYPSWGYMVEQGATSLWEQWEKGSRTYSHQMYGTFVQWYYEDLAGIEPLAPGFAEIEFAPRIPSQGLDWVATAYDSVRGTVATCWEKTPGGLAMDVTVPANATGVIRVPWTEANSVVEVATGRRAPAASADGLRLRGVEDGHLVYEAGSGTYHLRAGDAASYPLNHCGRSR